MTKQIPLSHWKEIYRLAKAVHDRRYWETYTENDWFGVTDPETGETGWILIIGGLGETFGLNVFMGDGGLEYLMAMEEMDPEESMRVMDAIYLHLEDGSGLTREERNVMKQLGMNFHGKNGWPEVGRKPNGSVPRQLNPDEARFFASIAPRVLELLEEHREDPEFFLSRENQVLISRKTAKGWKNEWKDFDSIVRKARKEEFSALSSLTWKDMDHLPFSGGSWQFGIFPLPAVRNLEPMALGLMAESESGFVLGFEIQPEAFWGKEAAESLLKKAVAETLQRPSSVEVDNPETRKMLQTASRALGFRIDQVVRLDAVAEAARGMQEVFKKHAGKDEEGSRSTAKTEKKTAGKMKPGSVKAEKNSAKKGERLYPKLEKVKGNRYYLNWTQEAEQIRNRYDKIYDLFEEGEDEKAKKSALELVSKVACDFDAWNVLKDIALKDDDKLQFGEYFEKQLIDMAYIDRMLPQDAILEWAHMSNRPYLRHLHRLALFLDDGGAFDDALLIYRRLIHLNPNDNQGIRELLVRSYFRAGDPSEVLKVRGDYRQDAFPALVFGEILANFQLGELKKAEKLVKPAVKNHPLIVEELLAEKHPKPKSKWLNQGMVAAGSRDESWLYWKQFGGFWKKTPGALKWLKANVRGSPALFS